MSSSPIPPWDFFNFVFDLPGSLPQCNDAWVQYWPIEKATPQPSPPYSMIFYSGGYEPLIIPLDNTAATGSSRWVPNLPLGDSIGVAMKDSKNYSSGLLERDLKLTQGARCDQASPLKPSSLDIALGDDGGQCQDLIVSISDGTGPYTVEVAPIGRPLKTIRFRGDVFMIKLDMSAGVQYWLAVYDSQGSSGVLGPYYVYATADNTCLGAVATIRQGRFSTIYPGGTVRPTVDVGSGAPSRSLLPTHMAIIMGVFIPILATALATALLWLCFRNSSRYYPTERRRQTGVGQPEIYSDYTPMAEEYSMATTSKSKLRQIFPGILGSESTNSSYPRRLVNPDLHHSGPIEAEPFDPKILHNPEAQHHPDLV